MEKRASRAKGTSQRVKSSHITRAVIAILEQQCGKQNFSNGLTAKKALTLSRASVRPKSHWSTAPAGVPVTFHGSAAFWPAAWLSACCLKCPARSIQSLRALSIFCLFLVYLSFYLSFLVVPEPQRMLLPYCSGWWVQGSWALCFGGAAGMQPGSGIWGSKSSQHNHSFPGLSGLAANIFYCLENNLLRLDTWDTLLLPHW